MGTTTAIDHINALINHPRTGDEERETARRLLSRLLAKAAREGDTKSPAEIYREQYGRTYGDKYDHSGRLSLTDIAKLIRADIRMARKEGKKITAKGGCGIKLMDLIGDAPEQIKIGVRTQYYSGGGSIDVIVKNLPADWAWTTVTDDWGHNRQTPTEALRAFARELKAISDAYNHDGSDPMVDYFDKRFYGHVSDEHGLLLA